MPIYYHDPAVLESPAQICDVHHHVALGPYGCDEYNAALATLRSAVDRLPYSADWASAYDAIDRVERVLLASERGAA